MSTISTPSSVRPSMTKQASVYNYLSSLDLKEGMYKPEVSEIFVQRYGRQDMTGLLDMLGKTNGIGNIEFTHYEQERIHGKFLVASAASAAAGSADIVLTMQSGDTYSFSGQSPYSTSNSFSSTMPQVYDQIEFGGFQAVVKAVSGTSVTAIRMRNDVAVPARAEGEEVIILGTAFPEFSKQGESRNSQLISYTGYLQTHRRVHKVSGQELGMKSWAEFKGKDGKVGYAWFLQGIADEYHRFLNEREGLLLAGQRANNLAAFLGTSPTGDFASVNTTEGYIPQVKNNGIVEGYSSAGLDLNDIDSMVRNLQVFRGDTENYLFCSHNFKLELDALVKGDFDNGAIIFNSFNGKDEQMVKYSIDKFEYGGFKFGTKVLDIFSDPSFLGYTGGEYQNIAMVTPMGETVTYNRQNSTSSTRVPSLRVNFLQTPDESRYYKEWVTGAGMGVANSDEDGISVHMLTQCGLEAFALNRHGLFVRE